MFHGSLKKNVLPLLESSLIADTDFSLEINVLYRGRLIACLSIFVHFWTVDVAREGRPKMILRRDIKGFRMYRTMIDIKIFIRSPDPLSSI